jgi:glyoxylase-like metal-dependent hydrolase (beta-lactamase superfamily II)
MLLRLSLCMLSLFGLGVMGAEAHMEQSVIAIPSRPVAFQQLKPGLWMHTSYQYVAGWGEVLSNGLIVETPQGSILVDTAWNDAQTLEILNWAHVQLKQPITAAVFTHFHEDKMGGVAMLRRHGVKTYAASDSNQFAVLKGRTPAAEPLVFNSQAVSGQLAPLVIFDPGPGHTLDNIVVGLPDQGIIFGGCLIRPSESTDLGNTGDADIAHWGQAVQAVATHFPSADVVIPSHGAPAGRELLQLTQDLVQQHLHKRP